MSTNPDINAAEASHASVDAPVDVGPVSRQGFWHSRGVRLLRSTVSKIIYRLDRLFGELTAIALGLGIACLWIASSVLERQSTDLTVLRPNIKIWVAEVFDGRDAEFGRLELAWQPADGNIVVTIEDAEIRGRDSEVLERFDLIRSTFAPSADLRTLPRLINTQIKGGVLTYLEDAEGRVTAGLGPPKTVGRVGPVYRSGDTKRSASDFKSILQDLEFVQIEDAVVYVQNATSGVNLKSNVDILRANMSEKGDLILTAMGTVDQTSTAMPFTLNTISESDFGAVKLRLKVTGARLDEIAPTKGRFWEFQGLAAPLDLTADIDFSAEEGLKSATVDMNISEGNFTLMRELNPRKFPFQSLVARASLAPGNERMDVQMLDLKAPDLSFKSSGFLSQLGNLNDGDVNSSPVFNLSFNDVRANMMPFMPVETNIKGLNLVGQADFDSRSLSISRGRLAVFDSVHEFNGSVGLESDNAIKSIELKSSMSGTLNPEQFLSLWPVKSFVGARTWVEGALLSSEITKVDAEIAFDEDFFETRVLTEDRFKFHFGGRDTTVKYMAALPPATGISGGGQIIGNRLTISMDTGQIEEIKLTSGTVDIPKLRPINGDIIVTVTGQGPTSEFMRLADYPPFLIASQYNVNPDEMEGAGDVTVRIQRSLMAGLPRDQIDHHIQGKFTGINAPFEFGKYKIANGDVTLDATRERVLMEGPVDIGPWRADMRWLETFGVNPPPTQYTVSGILDTDLLDNLGVPSRILFDGNAAVRIEAEGQGFDIAAAKLDVDLTNSALSVERIWTKSAGEAASLTAQLTRGTDKSYIVENMHLIGAGIDVGGEVSLEPDYKLRQIDLSNVSIDSFINGAVKITPDRVAGRLAIQLDAGLLDVSPWTEDLFAERKSNLDVPLTIEGKVAELILDGAYPVTDSELYFSHSGDVIEAARLEALSDGKPLKLELSTREDRKRLFTANIPDASKAVSAFMGLDNTTGGRLEITANLPAAGEEGAYTGEADMRDFKLNEAPVLAQLLSLASLTGLSDTLSGTSMQFDRFKVPFAILGDDIAIRDARLYGPALGMTGDGDVNLDQRVMHFDGTLVPAYTANSFLGDIPLIGDIFVREKGGGLFALTYTVSGPFEQTQIAVNPLSALTPGFLRRIFKRDRSKIDDSMKDAIEDVAPKDSDSP